MIEPAHSGFRDQAYRTQRAAQTSGADRQVVRRMPAPARTQRLLALDAFRGIAIAAMILVNNPGSWRDVYGPLRHAEWNGWTRPISSFPFSYSSSAWRSASPSAPRGRARRQSAPADGEDPAAHAHVFALGIILNGFPRFDWSVLRIPGVLQRIALCYFAASTAVLTLGIGGQAISAAVLLLGYWALMTLAPVSRTEPP